MIKRTLIAILISLFIALFSSLPVMAGDFPDVPRGHWAYDAVQFLSDNGFVIGYPDGTFGGDNVLTRYEFATVVTRIYDQLLEMADNDQSTSVDQQGVINMLMEEFQPDIDHLRDLIDVNSTRIGILETNTDALSTRVADVESMIDGLGGNSFNTSGDLRVRFEGLYPSSGLQTQRPRFRLRWGFTQPITPELTFGARLASGSLGAITSTNETIDDAFGLDSINIDRAYMQYAPASAPGFTVWAGKFSPPWKNTPLVWDSDTMVEGIAEQYTHGDFQLTLGQLVPVTKGFYFVAQAGANNLGVEGLSAFVTYHMINDDAWSVISGNMQRDSKDSNYLKSNWLWSYLDDPTEYQAIEGYLQYKSQLGSTPVALTLNYLRNLADPAVPSEGEPEMSALNQAAWAELAINGSPSDVGDWQGRVEWGRAQANSTLTWLADADRGGSDTEWWGARWMYRIMRNTDIAITYFDKDRIMKDSSEQILQVDVVTKF